MLTKSKTKKEEKTPVTNCHHPSAITHSLSQSDIQDKVGFAMYTIFDPNNTVKDVADTHDTHTLLQYY